MEVKSIEHFTNNLGPEEQQDFLSKMDVMLKTFKSEEVLRDLIRKNPRKLTVIKEVYLHLIHACRSASVFRDVYARIATNNAAPEYKTDLYSVANTLMGIFRKEHGIKNGPKLKMPEMSAKEQEDVVVDLICVLDDRWQTLHHYVMETSIGDEKEKKGGV